MFPDFKELLSILNEHRVKYLVVGAYAVAIHAQPRATKDRDILVEADADNAAALFAALAKFGAPLEGMTTADFSEAGPFFRMGSAPVEAAGRLQDLADVDAIRKAQRLRLPKKTHGTDRTWSATNIS